MGRKKQYLRLPLFAFAAALGMTYASAAITILPSTLPAAVTGTPYTVNLTATGGAAPYTWSGNGTFPPGLQVSPAGVISGTPTQPGSFTFSVQATDANGTSGSNNYSLTVTAGSLTITTVSPLFNGTVGSPYSQQFQASGGTQPYTWSVASGQVTPLTLNATTGVLQGTPTSAGTLNFTIQVTDASSRTASQAFSLTIMSPPLVISISGGGTVLPAAAVGLTYSQAFSASGGAPPYAWSIASGAVPGLTIDPATGVLSGTPTTAGSYTPVVKVTDSAMTAMTRQFQLTVKPAALQISTTSPLPSGTPGQPYSQTLSAQGGAPPYSWSAAGLPSGLSIDPATGTISGTSTAAGTFSVTVTVTDSSSNTAVNLFSLSMPLPPAPSISIGSIPASSSPASQVPVQVTIPQPYSAGAITGQITLSFTPATSGAKDPSIQFASGGTSATFTIAAGQTSAVFSVPAEAFATGTLAGTLTLSASAQAFGVDITPTPAPSQATTIAAAAPAVTAAQLSSSGQTITILVSGFSTTDQVTQAVFNFTATGNNQLQTAQFTVPVTTPFSTWYSSAAAAGFGSQFLYSQTFTVQGDATVVALKSVTLTNQTGSSTFQLP